MGVDLKASFFLSRVAGEHMWLAGTKGSISTFTSISATMGGVSSAPAYGASKGGVIALTYAMARHYGAFGIRVNSIAPGFIDTLMHRAGRPELHRQHAAGSRARSAAPVGDRRKRFRACLPGVISGA